MQGKNGHVLLRFHMKTEHRISSMSVFKSSQASLVAIKLSISDFKKEITEFGSAPFFQVSKLRETFCRG